MSAAPRPSGLLRVATATLALGNVLAATAALVIGAVAGSSAPAAGAVASALGTERVSSPATVLAASSHPLLATTSTTGVARTSGATREVQSTGYCLEGTTSSGERVGPGMVAMNGVALGTRWLVHEGPFRGRRSWSPTGSATPPGSTSGSKTAPTPSSTAAAPPPSNGWGENGH